MLSVLQEGTVDLIGIARPFCLQYNKVSAFLEEEDINNPKNNNQIIQFDDAKLNTGIHRDLDAGLQSFWHQQQIERISKNLSPDYNMSRLYSLFVRPLGTYVYNPYRNPFLSVVLLIALSVILIVLLSIVY